MSKYTGNDVDFTVGGTSISNIISVVRTPSMETYDATAAGQTDAEHLAGKNDDQYTINFLDDTAEATWDLFARGTTALACVHYPQGNSSGKPSETFNAFVTGKPRTVDHKAVTAVSVTLQVTGGVTEGTVA